MAQDKQGKLSGTLTDSSLKPLAYATVSLYKTGQLATAVKTTYTNLKGSFRLTADTGKYQLTISHTVFGDATTPVLIKSGDNEVTGLMLTASVHLLQNITVTSKKPLVEQGDDKLTYNVENDPAAKSESASDILRKTPLVTVDGDGNVQVNGQSNFKILLNGRETSMFAMNTKDALKNFPGAVISKIEVITAPSAKYDAEGVGGLINIITKKKVIGYNGYLSSYFSSLGNYGESMTLNVKAGKFGLTGYAGASGSAGNIAGRSMSETTPYVATVFTKRTLNGERLNNNFGGYGNLEVSYEIDSFNTISLYGSTGSYHFKSLLNQTITTERGSQPTETSLFNFENRSENPNSTIGSDFIRKYRNPDKELDFRFNGQFSKNNGFNNSFQDNPGQDRYVSNTSKSQNHEYTFQVDYAQPLKVKQKLETGVKAIMRSASSNFQSLLKYNSTDSYKANPANTDLFNYHQEVYSVYASYNTMLAKKYSTRLGLRAEHTDISGNFLSSKTLVEQHYTNLVPNVLVTRRFSGSYTLTASYNLRLQRPYITNLNPFVNNNDSLNISYGNPNLGPQILHAVSIQNRFTKGKLFAAVTLNGSYTNSMIVQFASFNKSTGVTSYTSANIGKETQLGLSTNLNTPLNDKINVGLNALVRYNHIENTQNVLQQKEGLSGSASANFYYKIIGQFTISGSGGISRSPYALINTSSTLGFYQVNFGYKFMHEKLSVTMNVNNFHSRYIDFRSVTEDPNFRIVSDNFNAYRVIYFGATYNFGKLKENVSKKKGVTNDDLVQ
ncbi:MAG: hypothetical protein JWN76_1676 [Chitinophagaceae bacterium]|nr:hypothetical protein [Chitinophagaceae bacterium]